MNISPDPKPILKHSRRVWKWAIVAGIILAAFGWIYYYEPLAFISDYWNNKASDVLTLIAALAAAMLATRLSRHFKPSEPPHRIWFTFALGWWAWVAGELLGFVYDYYYWSTANPEFTFMDLCWLLGYIFFGLSLFYQFRLIYRHKEGTKTFLYISFIALGLLVTFGLTQLALAAGLGEGSGWFGVYLSILYPVFDLFVGFAALWLFFLFGRGYLGRPWWGLIAFAVADAINIYFWLGGYEGMSDQIYYALDLFSNVFYVAGYLITALALLAAHDYLERGSTVRTSIS
jgi:hypothetical protein